MPVIIFPIMGSAIQISQESVQRAVKGASFAIYTNDEGFVTDALVNYLYRNNTVVPIEANTIEDALTIFTSYALLALAILNHSLTLSYIYAIYPLSHYC